MPTSSQQTLIEAVSAALSADPDMEAAWLAGSLGRGAGDAFSDVDVLALAAEGRADAAAARWAATGVAGIAEPVLVQKLFGGRVVNVVTADWDRFDVVFIGPGDLGRYDAAQLAPLFNRSGAEPLRRTPAPYRPDPGTVTSLATEFLRVLGLGPVGLGRGEYLVALSGVELLRRLTIDLMLEANAVFPAERGGALRRNPFLTPDQRHSLEALPPVAATAESLLAANAALTAIFLPLARRLAAETGAEWPAALERATQRRVEGCFGAAARWPR